MPPFEDRNGPPAAFETPRKQVVQAAREKQDYLSGEVEQPLQKQALDFANALPSLQAGLQNDPLDVQNEVDAIVNGLLDPRPGFGEPPTESMNRYLDWRTVQNDNGDTVYIYKIKADAVTRDLAFLTKLQGVHPELAGQLEDVKTSLNEYARRDERMVAHDIAQRRRESFTTEAVGQMGKTTLTIFLAFATALTGTMMFAKMIREKSFWKGFSLTPFIYGGILAFLASSKLRAATLGTAGEKALAPLDRILNHSSFNPMAKRYRMEGGAWAAIVEDLAADEEETNEFLAKLDAGKATQEGIDAYIAGRTGDPEISAALAEMIQNGDFARFAVIVRGANSPESLSVLVDYVKMGAWKHAK